MITKLTAQCSEKAFELEVIFEKLRRAVHKINFLQYQSLGFVNLCFFLMLQLRSADNRVLQEQLQEKVLSFYIVP